MRGKHSLGRMNDVLPLPFGDLLKRSSKEVTKDGQKKQFPPFQHYLANIIARIITYLN